MTNTADPAATDPPETGAPIATFDVVALDTPNPRALAGFYCALLGWQITDEQDDWITIRGTAGAGIAFQLAPNHVPPTWPADTVPQQIHLDLNVPDLDAAEAEVLALGARTTGQPEQPSSFRVYLDPSGHPFCLC
ncbi:MAG: VOC family protein, partial [Nakamurella sp.]